MAFVSRSGGGGGAGASPADEVVAAIERGEIAPIYCFYGGERFLVDRALAAVRAAVLSGKAAATAAFNHDVFDLREAGLPAVMATARTLPMLAPRRLVVGKGIDTVKAEDLEPLLAYVKDPNPHTCLVLTGEKVDTRTKPFLALRKAGHLHEMAPLRDREVPAWIAREARARKIALAPDAAGALAEAAGSDLGRLAQALEQLALYAGDRAITLGDVEELVAETRQRSVFELLRAIAEGSAPRALAILANMFRNREPALKIEFMLARQLRQIWRAKELAAAGTDRGEIAAAIGLPPYFLDEVLAPARRMSTRALARCLERLYVTDKTLKSSRIDDELLVARLVQQLADESRGGRAA